MYNIALRIINDTAEAEDVMQESFLKAFSKLDTFSGEVTFGAWLKKIVVNKSLDAIKTRKTLISLESVPELPDNSGSENYLDYRELNIDMVKQAIYRLPDGYRVVLSLYLVEGDDHDEISEILGISNATSRTQYHRARKHLAKKLNELKAVS
jgi:RNA polymerase sigma factor (sigma-70 family)